MDTPGKFSGRLVSVRKDARIFYTSVELVGRNFLKFVVNHLNW